MSEIIRIDESDGLKLERANLLLAGIKSGAIRAVYSALKRAAQRAKTESGRYAAAHYTITKGVFMSHVNSYVNVTGSSESAMTARVVFAGSVIPLIQFKTTVSGSGLNVTVKKGGGGTLEHAFVANINGLNIYERRTKKRYPLSTKYGPSAAHMMENPDVQQQMEQLVVDTFNTRIEHEITRVLNGWGA